MTNQPNPAQQASDAATYDRSLIADMLGLYAELLERSDQAGHYTQSAILEQAELLQAADNDEAARELTAAQGVGDVSADLSMLVRMLALDIRALADEDMPGEKSRLARANKAIDYLRRKGLDGSPLRDNIADDLLRDTTLSQPIEPQGAVVGVPLTAIFDAGYQWRGVTEHGHVYDGRDVGRTLLADFFDGFGIDAGAVDGMATKDAGMVQAKAEINRALAALPVAVGAGEDQDGKRYRYLRSKAHQNTAYDVFGAGGHWSIGIHSPDNNLTLDAVVDTAMTPATPAGKGEL